jgi:hypothetical protein
MATMSGASCGDDKNFRARVKALGINGGTSPFSVRMYGPCKIAGIRPNSLMLSK